MLKRADVTFLRGLITDKPEHRRLGPVSQAIADNEGIGKIQGARVVYTPADHEKARNLLLSRGYTLEQPAEPFPRSQAPAGGSEKDGAQRVSEHLVAVNAFDLPEVDLPQGAFVALNWQDAIKLEYEVLLVVENMEPLQHVHRYRWMRDFVRGRRTLAVFKGAPGWFRTEVAAQLVAADTRPTLAFFDFDPKGLDMALSVPRREGLCLPPPAALEERVKEQRREHLFTNSYHQCRSRLDACPDPAIAQAWQLMKRLTLGLDQEHFPT